MSFDKIAPKQSFIKKKISNVKNFFNQVFLNMRSYIFAVD